MRVRIVTRALTPALLCFHLHVVYAQSEPEPEPDAGTETITIREAPPAEAASSVHLSAEELARRPHANASDLLRQAPGLVVAQHAGGGKADQLFLRGFDADHGTDVALFVDGVPINLTSHGHGQGYADTHWLIPDTIGQVDIHKGPYSARFGDFYTAGAVEFRTIDSVPGGLRVLVTGTSELAGPVSFDRAAGRLVALASPKLPAGKTLLAAELGDSDGPFIHPQKFQHLNGLARWTGPLGPGELTFASTIYGARWEQSGQIPSAEVAAGRLDRFGSVDPSEGGNSSRQSASLRWDSGADKDRVRLQAALVHYRLDLFSDFTLYARDQMNGDEIEQTDARTFFTTSGAYTRQQSFGSLVGTLTAGAQLRSDFVDTGLWHDRQRVRLADCFDSGQNPCNSTQARIWDLGGYLEEDLFVAPWLEVIAGLRYDAFFWNVDDKDPMTAMTPETTGGSAQRGILGPKLSLIARPTDGLELFANGGSGFHSNDARAAVASEGNGALARAWGAEVGARWRPLPTLSSSAAAWYLYLASEQVWSGDAGGTEPSDPTRRLGLDLDVAWDVTRWLRLDANVAFAHSTFVANHGNGGALALAPRVMGGGGVAVHKGRSELSLRARGIGDRPANDENTLTAEGYLIFDLVASHRQGPWEFGLTVVNLLNSDWREAQFAEASRVTPGAAIVEDVHFTPGAPLTGLMTVGYNH